MTRKYPAIINQCKDQPFRILRTPSITEKPTASATVNLSSTAYLLIANSVGSIMPPLLATIAASCDTDISAGSAMVVPKPSANANKNSQNNEPFFTNAWARFSPIGKSPNLRPETKKVKPIRTDKPPKSILPNSGMG